MKNCKKCNSKFEPVNGLINFCSLKCRNSRTWSENDKIKKSISAKNSEKVKIANLNAIQKRKKSDPNLWIRLKKIREEKRKDQILKANYEDLHFEQLRERIIYEQNCKCNKCGLSTWLGESIPLELEHKDGNHFNNDRNNLEILCSNCHGLTDTWRGRNKKNANVGRINDEKLLENLLINDWNMRKSLMAVNLAPKGGNYKRCHKLKREYLAITQTN